MKNLTTLLIIAIALTACRKAPHATGATRPKGGEATAHFVLVIGQSNADGRCTAARLVNPAWAYKGISALPL
ncbi:MAG TPA: hypothetical protein PKY96_18460, partial [Flavobacteriales bacterium]|nr:hypothetical protein [Flavobacteriales bacterium]